MSSDEPSDTETRQGIRQGIEWSDSYMINRKIQETTYILHIYRDNKKSIQVEMCIAHDNRTHQLLLEVKE
jgi:hypothetical protein